MTVFERFKLSENPFKVIHGGETKWVVGSFFADSSAMVSKYKDTFDTVQIVQWSDLELIDSC